jgi:hypothetical protein
VALTVISPRPDNTGTEDAPPPLQQPGVVVNHAILVAEILGIDAAAALDAVNAVHDLPSALPRVFVPEDQVVMTDFLERLGPALDDAVDPAGRPAATAAGQTLANSEHVRTESDGTLTIRSRSLPIAELRTAVAQALDIFRYAHQHGLLVRLD